MLGLKIKSRLFGRSILTLCIVVCTSCSKEWLDERPNRNLKVPVSIMDAELLMDGIEMNRSGLSLAEVSSPDHYVTEDRWLQGFSEVQINAYTWTNGFPYLKVADWQFPYEGILNANIALNTLKNVVPSNQMEKVQMTQTIGNALFHRARYHFELAQLYCPPYDNANLMEKFGLPLRLEADPASFPIRSTVGETYEQILSDILLAKQMLPNLPKYKTRASKASVFALLSNVYLSMRKYSLSKSYADSCLAIQSDLLDYNKATSASGYLGKFNSEVIFHSTMTNYNSMTSSGRVNKGLYDSYSNNDLRKTLFYRLNADNTLTFRGSYSDNSLTPFSGLAVDEMFLNRAEGYARENNTEKAMADLNKLLLSRWKNSVPYHALVANNPKEALSFIIAERRKELVFRGRTWIDLRRLNMEDQFKLVFTRTVGGTTYTLEPNSYKYTFPIPVDEVQQSGIQQNPGWDK